ncbi:MFS transporter [Arthrobacter sp. M4]|uniref:MFS transporter n=1 Tax=Arthrobacter sp. M4 TaxID=218160 RepID=UPI001CDC58CC|nr:MFS transporter [Arthrobacter sp. M4]MCA4132408.1 MFS transporter [Arthrobacter sp. M4]
MTVFGELRMRPASADRPGWDASTTARLVLAGVVIFTLLTGANLATPLYPLLQEQLAIPPVGITVAFASYVLALVGALVLAGHWSDHIGRRAALVLAVVVGLAGCLVFGSATNITALCAGRALQGIAVALATGASSAALRELLPHRPEWASRFTLLSSAGGVAVGPAIGGALSQLTESTATPFYLHAIVLVALLIPLWLLKARPALKPALGPRPLALLAPRRPEVARGARGAFWLASGVGFLSFAVFGFCLSLAPGYFANVVGTDSRLVIGAVAGLSLGASALSQLTGIRSRLSVPVGLVVMGGSVVLMVASVWWSSPWLLLAASVFAGLGQGVAFRTAFNDVAARTSPERHAQVVSAVYILTYLGSALPVVGLGIATAAWGITTAVAAFAWSCGGAGLLLAGIALRAARK